MSAPKLYDTDHPYYGPEGNYFANWHDFEPYKHTFDSWADFMKSDFPKLDKDYNFLFRWDWKKLDREDFDDEEWAETEGKREYVELYYVMQRKSNFLRATIYVTREDEPAVREFLDPHWSQMITVWEGVSHEF